MPIGASWISCAIRSWPTLSAERDMRNSHRSTTTHDALAGTATLARVEARRRALGGRCGRSFGFAVAGLLRIVLSFLARAALDEFLAVAPGALQAGVGLL